MCDHGHKQKGSWKNVSTLKPKSWSRGCLPCAAAVHGAQFSIQKINLRNFPRQFGGRQLPGPDGSFRFCYPIYREQRGASHPMHISSPYVVVSVLIAVFTACILFATSSKEDNGHHSH